MHQRLAALPNVKCVKPQGAFYCFPNVSSYYGKTIGGAEITGAVPFAAALLEQNHVAVVPGTDSGVRHARAAQLRHRHGETSTRESTAIAAFLAKAR